MAASQDTEAVASLVDGSGAKQVALLVDETVELMEISSAANAAVQKVYVMVEQMAVLTDNEKGRRQQADRRVDEKVY